MKNRYIIFFGSVLFDMLAAVVSFFLALAVGGIAYYDCGRQLFYFTIPVWAGLLVLSFFKLFGAAANFCCNRRCGRGDVYFANGGVQPFLQS